MDLLVEDSSVPTNTVSSVNTNSSSSGGDSSGGDDDDEKESLVSSSFPIKLEDDVENQINSATNDEVTRTSKSTGNTNDLTSTKTTKKKKKKNYFSKLSSTITHSTAKNKKEAHLLELTKMIRKGYKQRIPINTISTNG